jgi:hypothetical protein
MKVLLKKQLFVKETFAFISAHRSLIKNKNKIFLLHKEIQMGSGAKSFMRKGFLI